MSQSKYDQKIIRTLHKVGYDVATKLTNTLQGSIWRASNNNETSVIKVTNIFMHKHKLAIINGKQHTIQEDILLEKSILKYITQFKNCPKSIVKYKRFFRTNTDYFLVMEDGGSSLFDFILKAHDYVRNGDIEIIEWQRVCKVIFKQMIECISFLHSKNVCHFDISLENFLINDVNIEVEQIGESEKITILTDNIQIKLCDFGLSKLFTRTEALSSKFVGKPNYKSPEIMNKKKGFDAKLNDSWCIGISLFMIITCISPWNVANDSDQNFIYIMDGKLIDLLAEWNILYYFDEELIDLFENIFQYESNRISINKIEKHAWINEKRMMHNIMRHRPRYMTY
eukprot:182630_1